MIRLVLILLPLLWSCTQPTDPTKPCVEEMARRQSEYIPVYADHQPLIEACGALDPPPADWHGAHARPTAAWRPSGPATKRSVRRLTTSWTATPWPAIRM